MVAFELAQWHEKAGNHADSAQWYTTAAQRFRRAQWRVKAEEALARLGAPVPDAALSASAPGAETTSSEATETPVGEAQAMSAVRAIPTEETPSLFSSQQEPAVDGDSESESEAEADETETAGEPAEAQPGNSTAPAGADGSLPKRKRRRGRRGGRGRSRGKGVRTEGADAAGPAAHASGQASLSAPTPVPQHISRTARPQPQPEPVERPERAEWSEQSEPEPTSRPTVERSHQPSAAAPSYQGRTRAGEPALASRISQLESQLRRLLACQQALLDDSDQAPAGPGVLLLSDSDQVTHYYIEACQTLRIGIGNLMRGGRGSEAIHLKERMAENLGIAEARVPKYLKDHCVVRWLQLDEGAKELSHFAISVLRPAVNG